MKNAPLKSHLLPTWFTLLALLTPITCAATPQATIIAPTATFQLPTVDLSADKSRHIVVARGTNEVYQGHPTTVLLPDGKTIYCVWTHDHGGPCGPMKRSDDGGLTWSELLPTPDNWRQSHNCPAIYRLVDPRGNARLLVFAGTGPGKTQSMHSAVSEDDGKTWSPMRDTSLGPVVMPFTTIIPVEGGKRLLGMTNIRRPGETKERRSNILAQSFSTDGGITWSPFETIRDIPGLRLCEPEIIRSPDGRQLLCLIREDAKNESLFMTSNDDGKTWSKENKLPVGLWGDRHKARYTPDGRLVIVFRDVGRRTSPTTNHFVAWIGTYHDIITGRDGAYRVKLIHNHRRGKIFPGRLMDDCGYPGLEVLPDSTLVATTYAKYTEGDEGNYVITTRFKLSETDAILATLSAAATASTALIPASIVADYTEAFNRHDTELYPQLITNARAADFLAKNIPRLACPDPALERTYYFRWWTFRKHIRATADGGHFITEFLAPVPQAGPENSISCPAGHHFREARWLRDQTYLNDTARFWLLGGGQHKKPRAQQPVIRVYSFWVADSLLQQVRVTGDDSLARELLPALIANYEGWENTRRDPNGLYWQRDLWDGMEESSAFAEFGGKDFRDDNHYRVTINSYMAADALAIASLAQRIGDAKTAALYEQKAAEIIALRDTKLWDPSADFYKVAFRGDAPKNTLDNLRLNTDREQLAYVAWYFDNTMPPAERDTAWRQLSDPNGFHAPYGPTTCERRGKYYQIAYTGRRYCQWNGPSWPFATAQTLTALANVINNRLPAAPATAQLRKDWLDTLACYVRSHTHRLDDGTLVPWIDENLNPYTGDWLAGTRHRNNPTGRTSPLHHKDYNHSTFCDIIITALAGLCPAEGNTFTVNPIIPGTWDWFCLEDIPYHGKLLTILYDKTGAIYNRGPGLRVFANNKEIATGPLGDPLHCKL